jgi:hypothetical protein
MEMMADAWFMELGREGGPAGVIAGMLLATQVKTYRVTGHLIDFSQELPRRHIGQRARHGYLWKGYVRCLRCGTQALLGDWVGAVKLLPEDRAFTVETAPDAHRRLVAYLDKCPGHSVVQDAALLLDVVGLEEE